MNKPTFEQCLDYIENTLGYKLLDYQKELLSKHYNAEKVYFILGRDYGKTMLKRAQAILNELLNKENDSETT